MEARKQRLGVMWMKIVGVKMKSESESENEKVQINRPT